MNRKIIFIIILCLMFVGKAKAYNIEEFFDLAYKNCTISTSNPLQRDCYNSNGKLISYVLDLEHRTISYELETINIKDAVSSSYILRYLVNYAPIELVTEYKKYRSIDKTVDYNIYNCQMDKSGYCFEDNGDNSTMTVKIDTTFIRFLISEFKGVPIEMIEYVENEDPFDAEGNVNVETKDDSSSEDDYEEEDYEEEEDFDDEEYYEDVEETPSEIKEIVYKKDDSANIIIIVLFSIIVLLVIVIMILVFNLNKIKKDNVQSIEG